MPSIQETLNTDLVTLSTLAAATAGVGYTVMRLMRSWGMTKTNGAKASAESSLYETLREQIEGHAELIATLQSDKSEWVSQRAELIERVKQLEKIEAQNEILKEKLDTKDNQLAELISEIVRKTTEITELRERVHVLEMRLAKDENEWCKDCKFNTTGEAKVSFKAISISPSIGKKP